MPGLSEQYEVMGSGTFPRAYPLVCNSMCVCVRVIVAFFCSFACIHAAVTIRGELTHMACFCGVSELGALRHVPSCRRQAVAMSSDVCVSLFFKLWFSCLCPALACVHAPMACSYRLPKARPLSC